MVDEVFCVVDKCVGIIFVEDCMDCFVFLDVVQWGGCGVGVYDVDVVWFYFCVCDCMVNVFGLLCWIWEYVIGCV